MYNSPTDLPAIEADLAALEPIHFEGGRRVCVLRASDSRSKAENLNLVLGMVLDEFVSVCDPNPSRAVTLTRTRTLTLTLTAHPNPDPDPNQVAIYDADHHADPDSLARMMDLLQARGCDAVQGSTYIRNVTSSAEHGSLRPTPTPIPNPTPNPNPNPTPTPNQVLEGSMYINGSPQNTFVPGVIELAEK